MVRDPLDDIQERTFADATAATSASYPESRRLIGEQLTAYLERRSFAVIGSTRPDGRPHAAITSFLRRGTTFWLPAVEGSVRARNLSANPWATLTITEGDRDRHVVVLVEGRADVLAPGEVPSDVLEAVDGAWAHEWLRLEVRRLLSYASENVEV